MWAYSMLVRRSWSVWLSPRTWGLIIYRNSGRHTYLHAVILKYNKYHGFKQDIMIMICLDQKTRKYYVSIHVCKSVYACIYRDNNEWMHAQNKHLKCSKMLIIALLYTKLKSHCKPWYNTRWWNTRLRSYLLK